MKKLSVLLNDMDIPEIRRELTTNNLRWLLRNLGIRNSNHLHFKEVMELIKKFLNDL